MNDCTSKHQDYDIILECTNVHANKKIISIVLGSCNKGAGSINQIHSLVSKSRQALDHTYTLFCEKKMLNKTNSVQLI